MDGSLGFKRLVLRKDVLEYIHTHSQNSLVTYVVEEILKAGEPECLVIIPSRETIADEDLYHLSAGWRIFSTNVRYGNRSPYEFITSVLKKFLEQDPAAIGLFPSEYPINSPFQAGREAVFVHIDRYPYELLPTDASIDTIDDAQDSASGFLCNGLLMRADSVPDSWEEWLNEMYQAKAMAAFVRCIILDAYDSDSYLLIVPDKDKALMEGVLESCLKDMKYINN